MMRKRRKKRLIKMKRKVFKTYLILKTWKLLQDNLLSRKYSLESNHQSHRKDLPKPDRGNKQLDLKGKQSLKNNLRMLLSKRLERYMLER
jgi:hypothetical protein